jgi:subtilisin family serine protease
LLPCFRRLFLEWLAAFLATAVRPDDADAVAVAAKNPLAPVLAGSVFRKRGPAHVDGRFVIQGWRLLPAASAVAAVGSGIEKTGMTMGAVLFGYGLIAVGALHVGGS